jgi:hypothetical protein
MAWQARMSQIRGGPHKLRETKAADGFFTEQTKKTKFTFSLVPPDRTPFVPLSFVNMNRGLREHNGWSRRQKQKEVRNPWRAAAEQVRQAKEKVPTRMRDASW